MSWSDPISDMLTRIRNAHMAGMDIVEMPFSKLKGEITRVLKREGYVSDFVVEGGNRKTLRIYLRYTGEREPAIQGIKRDSRPGRRRYVGVDDIPRILGGLGVAVISTPLGVITDTEAREKHVGGEVVCSVW
ncbi:30S ribosomal protein S8 [Verrucomicrobiota bacterium]